MNSLHDETARYAEDGIVSERITVEREEDTVGGYLFGFVGVPLIEEARPRISM